MQTRKDRLDGSLNGGQAHELHRLVSIYSLIILSLYLASIVETFYVHARLLECLC